MSLLDFPSSKLRTLSSPPRRSALLFWIAVLCTIAVSIIILGMLQYRWSTEIRKASETRVGTELESTMMKWHLDFYSEISAICNVLQIGPDSGARDNWDDYLQRYTQWRHARNSDDQVESIYTNPDLVKDVYIWETSAEPRPRLLRLNPGNQKIEKSAVPTDLVFLLTHLQRNASSLRVALHSWKLEQFTNGNRASEDQLSSSHMLRGDAVAGWQFDEEVPAIVHPILRRIGSGPLPANALSNDEPVDWVVAVLNLEPIEKRLLPRLAQHYFSSNDELEYKVAVVKAGRTPGVLYSSDSDFVGDVHISDAVMNIFGAPPGNVGEQLWKTETDRDPSRPDNWKRLFGPVWFPVIQHTSRGGSWLLTLKSRKGSLDTAVTTVWRTHLLTSAAVLLLLAVSIVLVIVSSRRAEALANLQMNFVTSISHELRTPLAAILSAGQNLTDGFATDLKLYGWLITTQARQEIDLVDQILLFASTNNGAKNYVLQPLEVTSVLQQVQRDTAPLFERSGFTVDFRIAESLPPIVADWRFLSRCLHNLIGNAAKYSGDSRWIGVSAELATYTSEKRVQISVADRGIGICPSELPRIFEPFYRSPSVLASQIHGTGLGLSVTKHLVEAMGGGVSVLSEPGVGSTFTLYFQVATSVNSEMVA